MEGTEHEDTPESTNREATGPFKVITPALDPRNEVLYSGSDSPPPRPQTGFYEPAP